MINGFLKNLFSQQKRIKNLDGFCLDSDQSMNPFRVKCIEIF